MIYYNKTEIERHIKVLNETPRTVMKNLYDVFKLSPKFCVAVIKTAIIVEQFNPIEEWEKELQRLSEEAKEGLFDYFEYIGSWNKKTERWRGGRSWLQ